MKIIALDPGNSTGWAVYDTDLNAYTWCGTVGESLLLIKNLLDDIKPDIVIYERFALYPKLAKSLAWNTFYPCEVIGVIKLWVAEHNVKLVCQGADVKKYSGGLDEKYALIKASCSKDAFTEHTKDAFLHMQYYLRNRKT